LLELLPFFSVSSCFVVRLPPICNAFDGRDGVGRAHVDDLLPSSSDFALSAIETPSIVALLALTR